MYVKRKVKAVSDEFAAFFNVEGAVRPANIIEFVNMCGAAVTHQVTGSIKGSLMGTISAARRQDTAEAREFTGELLTAQNPMLGAGFKKLPKKWQNFISDNPDLVNQFVSGIVASPKPNGNGNSGGHKWGD